MKSITYFDDEQKCWTTFSCDDCEDLRQLKAERDAAVRDLKEYGTARGFTCEVCTHKRGTKYTPCFYPDGVDVDDEMCRTCGRCKCGHCDGVSQWEWRGPQQEET